MDVSFRTYTLGNCPICLDPLTGEISSHDQGGETHPMHEACLKQWLKNKAECPVCRAKPSLESPPLNGRVRPQTSSATGATPRAEAAEVQIVSLSSREEVIRAIQDMNNRLIFLTFLSTKLEPSDNARRAKCALLIQNAEANLVNLRRMLESLDQAQNAQRAVDAVPSEPIALERSAEDSGNMAFFLSSGLITAVSLFRPAVEKVIGELSQQKLAAMAAAFGASIGLSNSKLMNESALLGLGVHVLWGFGNSLVRGYEKSWVLLPCAYLTANLAAHVFKKFCLKPAAN